MPQPFALIDDVLLAHIVRQELDLAKADGGMQLGGGMSDVYGEPWPLVMAEVLSASFAARRIAQRSSEKSSWAARELVLAAAEHLLHLLRFLFHSVRAW